MLCFVLVSGICLLMKCASQSTRRLPQTATTAIQVPIQTQLPPKTSFIVTSTGNAIPTSIRNDVIEEIETNTPANEQETITNDSEQPQPTMPPPTNPLNPTGPKSANPENIDPTDYSTVWPTRWRPRGRRFGAQNDAAQSVTVNGVLVLLNFAFIIGIFL